MEVKESINHLLLNRIRDKTWVHLIKREGSTGEDAVILQYICSHCVLNQRKSHFHQKTNSFWKPSEAEMQDAFALHTQNAKDIPRIISKRGKTEANGFKLSTFLNFEGTGSSEQ